MLTRKSVSLVVALPYRLWYVTASARKALGAADQQNHSVPVEIGYMNVIPKCLDSSGKYPVYENLPETYAAINSYLADNPLEGISRRSVLVLLIFLLIAADDDGQISFIAA